MFVTSFFAGPRVRDHRSPHWAQASRDLLSSSAGGLIVRKLPEFVKKNRLTSGEFQRLVKLCTAAAGLRSLFEYSEIS